MSPAIFSIEVAGGACDRVPLRELGGREIFADVFKGGSS